MGANKEKTRITEYVGNEVSELMSSPELGICLFSEKMQMVYCNSALLKMFDASNIDDLKSIPIKLFLVEPNLGSKLIREISRHKRLREKAISYYTLRKKIRTLYTSGKYINYKGTRYFLVWINPDKKHLNPDSNLIFHNQKLMKFVAPRRSRLQKHEPPIKRLFRLSREPMISFDRLSIIDCNTSFLHEFGYKFKNELIGKDISMLLPENQNNGQKSFDLINELLIQLEGVKDIMSFKWDHQKKDASIIPCYVSIIPVKEKDDTYYYMLIRDIENNSNQYFNKTFINEDLRLKEERDLLFHLSPDMLCIINENGEFVQVNPSWKKILGWDSEELINTLWIDLIHPQDINSIFDSRTPNSKHPKSEFDARISSKDGSYKWVEWKATISDSNQMMYAIVRNIADKKLREKKLANTKKELEELNAQKDRFLTIISHDLESPLSSISQLSDILLDQYDYLDKDEKINCLLLMRDSARSTLNLAQDILVWAKGQMGKLELKGEKIFLKKVVVESIKNLELRISSKQIVIENNLSDDIYCFADLNSIKTVIRNIISNAVKFTSKEGKILIEAEVKRDKCIVSINDTGIGMSQELMNKLFDVTHVLTTSGTESEKGNGLGLMICKGLIEKNNGQLWVHSKVNVGSTFFFSLPLREI